MVDIVTPLRMAADCFACGALLQMELEIEEGHALATIALGELPPEHAARLRAVLSAAEPGNYRALAYLLDQMADELEPPPKPTKQRRPRKATLADVLKQAAKAGVPVARVELDGGVTLVLGESSGEKQDGNELDKWIAKHAH